MLVWYSPQEGLFIGKSQSIPGKLILNAFLTNTVKYGIHRFCAPTIRVALWAQLSANGPLLTSLFLFQGKFAPSKMLYIWVKFGILVNHYLDQNIDMGGQIQLSKCAVHISHSDTDLRALF